MSMASHNSGETEPRNDDPANSVLKRSPRRRLLRPDGRHDLRSSQPRRRPRRSVTASPVAAGGISRIDDSHARGVASDAATSDEVQVSAQVQVSAHPWREHHLYDLYRQLQRWERTLRNRERDLQRSPSSLGLG